MKKWYQSTILRVVLMLTVIVATMVGFVSFMLLADCAGNFSMQDFFSKEKLEYEETDSFEDILHQASAATLYQQSVKEKFETDGKYDPNKLVDIMTYAKDSQITGKNESGIAYKVSDLLSWYSATNGEFYNYRNNNIIVCQRPDGTYYYYYTGEFQNLLEEGELSLELDEDYSVRAFLEELSNGYYDSAEHFAGNILLKNKENETLYTDCWAFTESLDEMAAPDGGKNLLEIVNKTENLNGKLSEIYENLEFTLENIQAEKEVYDNSLESSFEEGDTNFSYYLYNEESDTVYTNNSAYIKEKNADKVIADFKGMENAKYIVVRPKLKDFESNMEVSPSKWKNFIKSQEIVDKDFVYVVSVDTGYPIQDEFYEGAKQFEQYAPHFTLYMVLFVIAIVLLAISIVWLTIIAGHREDEEGIVLYRFDRWKTEVAAAVVFGVWLFVSAFVMQFVTQTGVYYEINGTTHYSGTHFDTWSLILIGICGFESAIFFLIGYLSLVRRIKAKVIWKDSLCRICLHFLWKCCKLLTEFWRQRSLIWKMIVVLFVFCFIHWMAFAGAGAAIMLALILEVLAAAYLLWGMISKERIRKGVKRIAEGDVTHQIVTDKMYGMDKEITENINHISDGLQNAVNEMMKSERLKTDLITNVSHDIKTPLTSIINYVDLLKRENIENPKIQGYIQILEEKSQRLKTLTEDVVEASKVSSGNISLQYMDVNLVEMVNQTIGEFSEKFDARDLKIIANLSEEPAIIHVDNRRMWRVLENIFNNAAKYAMPSTRVYADLKKENGKVIFTLKNISEQPLNIKADELTERFIRGDISRSTEGSGLGLSIAKNLTELQGGKFELYLDGDLFKVNIEFSGR